MGKDLEGNDCGIILGTISALVWDNWGRPWSRSVSPRSVSSTSFLCH